MKDRRLGQAIIILGCLLLITAVVPNWIVVLFILSGMSQLQKKPLDTEIDSIKGNKPKVVFIL